MVDAEAEVERQLDDGPTATNGFPEACDAGGGVTGKEILLYVLLAIVVLMFINLQWGNIRRGTLFALMAAPAVADAPPQPPEQKRAAWPTPGCWYRNTSRTGRAGWGPARARRPRQHRALEGRAAVWRNAKQMGRWLSRPGPRGRRRG